MHVEGFAGFECLPNACWIAREIVTPNPVYVGGSCPFETMTSYSVTLCGWLDTHVRRHSKVGLDTVARLSTN